MLSFVLGVVGSVGVRASGRDGECRWFGGQADGQVEAGGIVLGRWGWAWGFLAGLLYLGAGIFMGRLGELAGVVGARKESKRRGNGW